MNNPNDRMLFELSGLVLSGWNNTLSGDEFVRLENMLRNSQRARDCYYDLLVTQVALSSTEGLLSMQSAGDEYAICIYDFDSVVWQMLAEEEKTAPVVIEKVSTSENVSTNTILAKPAKTRHKVSKFSKYAAVFSVAALLLLVIFVNIAPEKPRIVGRIDDSLNALWADTDHDIEFSGDIRACRYILEAGYAKVIMDSGADSR